MVLLARMIIFSIAEYFQVVYTHIEMDGCMYFLVLFFYIDEYPLYLLNQELVHRAASMHQL